MNGERVKRKKRPILTKMKSNNAITLAIDYVKLCSRSQNRIFFVQHLFLSIVKHF